MFPTLIYFGVIIFNIFCNPSKKEEKSIQINFAIDDSIQNIENNFNVDFFDGYDTLKSAVRNNYLVLPVINRDTTYEVIFTFSQYTLSFKGITKKMIVPEQNIEWRFGVDNKPFNNLLGLLPYGESISDTTTKQLIYFQFLPMEYGTGIQFVQKK